VIGLRTKRSDSDSCAVKVSGGGVWESGTDGQGCGDGPAYGEMDYSLIMVSNCRIGSGEISNEQIHESC
jgi:hypothetical protein